MVSDMIPMLEASASMWTGVGSLPALLNDDQRRKGELVNAINRLKREGWLRAHGTGDDRRVKLIHTPDWLVRDKPLMDSAATDADQWLFEILHDGDWHSVDTVLGTLQDTEQSDV